MSARNKGHWIISWEDYNTPDGFPVDRYVCSVCGKHNNRNKYCGCCGAEMSERPEITVAMPEEWKALIYESWIEDWGMENTRATYDMSNMVQIVQGYKYRYDATFRAMINDIILEYYRSDECKEIYGYMYGIQYIFDRPSKIIKIEKDTSLYLAKNRTTGEEALVYVWGWPGPDISVYSLKDYGITWAFREEDIKKMTVEEWREKENEDGQEK